MMTVTIVEKYLGVQIEHDSEYGYFGYGGASCDFGYADTIEELRAEIDDHFGEEEPPLDTPCIDDFMHRYEMDV